MYKVEELFMVLSKEKKDLKPNHAYKPAEEGLLKAMFFFRWLNKKDYKNTDKVVEAFVKNKIPEQQLEHYGCALNMIDNYETEEEVKKAIVYINEEYKKKTGKEILDSIPEPKIRRRVMKNVYIAYKESLDRLKNRARALKSFITILWVAIAILLFTNVALVLTGIYHVLLIKIIPGVLSGNEFLLQYGGNILGALLFIIPSLIIIFVFRHRINEFSKKSSVYPEFISLMENNLNEFKMKLKELNVNVE
ncbi:MAG: hypothetical protein K8T10_09565 [Candidatus Eremiobacteraeota bacterium]|nr:hypothetical protein [Candidatus Eremiobacteraeota bacterium]